MEPVRESWTDERLDDLKDRVDDGFRRMDDRFVQMDDRFGRVDRRVEQLDARLTSRIDGLQRSISTLTVAYATGFLILAGLIVSHG